MRTSATAAAIGVYGSTKQNDYGYPRPNSPYLRPQSVEKSRRTHSNTDAKKTENSIGYSGSNRPAAYNSIPDEYPKLSNTKTSNRPSSAGPTNRSRPTSYVPPTDHVNAAVRTAATTTNTASSNKVLSWMNAGMGTEKPITSNTTGKQATILAAYQTSPSGGYARPKSAGTTRQSSQKQQTNAKYMYSSNSDKIEKPIEDSRKHASDGKTVQKDVVQLQKEIAAAASKTRTSGIQPSGYQVPKEHWTTSYRVHYGSGSGTGSGTGNSTTASSSNVVPPTAVGTTHQTTTSGMTLLDKVITSSKPPSTQPSATTGADAKLERANSGLPPKPAPLAASRMQAAIAHGNRVGQGYSPGVCRAPADLGSEVDVDEDEGEGDLGDPMEGADVDDDEADMDGKRVSDSRSRPEVTTPSQSLEFDIRANSSTSVTMTCGLSSLPNEYCSANEAQELKKHLFSSLRMSLTPGMASTNSNAMDMYMVGKVVGVGSYGKVRAAWHRLSGAKVAIKTYDKTKMKDPAHWKRVQSEIAIMEEVSHPRIARMFEAVETTKRVHIVMECIEGGNLCSYVKAKRRLSEEESRRIFFQLLQAMDYLHNLNVIHRDIKLENVLFGEGKDIKLIDFGFSTIHQQGKRHRVFCGTPSYMAPEIVKRLEYEGKPTDMWSMGVLLYALLCGCFPFRARTYPDLYRRIARGYFSIPEELSPAVRDLVHQLLTVDPHSRATTTKALSHPWLQTQLVSAPDISRLRSENPILISQKPLDDLNDQVLAEMQLFGISRDEIIRQVSNKMHTPITTLYYLLRKNVVNSRKILGTSRIQKHIPMAKRDSPVTGAYALSQSPVASPTATTASSPTHADITPQTQTLQGILAGARPQSASAGRTSGGFSSRPRSATATRIGGRG